jgi:hypothetical protein
MPLSRYYLQSYINLCILNLEIAFLDCSKFQTEFTGEKMAPGTVFTTKERWGIKNWHRGHFGVWKLRLLNLEMQFPDNIEIAGKLKARYQSSK